MKKKPSLGICAILCLVLVFESSAIADPPEPTTTPMPALESLPVEQIPGDELEASLTEVEATETAEAKLGPELLSSTDLPITGTAQTVGPEVLSVEDLLVTESAEAGLEPEALSAADLQEDVQVTDSAWAEPEPDMQTTADLPTTAVVAPELESPSLEDMPITETAKAELVSLFHKVYLPLVMAAAPGQDYGGASVTALPNLKPYTPSGWDYPRSRAPPG
jgi:hypothetical protein